MLFLQLSYSSVRRRCWRWRCYRGHLNSYPEPMYSDGSLSRFCRLAVPAPRSGSTDSTVRRLPCHVRVVAVSYCLTPATRMPSFCFSPPIRCIFSVRSLVALETTLSFPVQFTGSPMLSDGSHGVDSDSSDDETRRLLLK